MQLIEIVSITLLIVSWAIYLAPIKKRPKWLLLFPAVTIISMATQIIFEAVLWSMVPAYLLAFLVFALNAFQLLHKPATKTQPIKRLRRILGVTGKVFCCLLLVLAVALPMVFPVFNLPKPSGSYAVGTKGFEWVDESRPETFTPDPTDHRDIMVQVWYPAQEVTNEKPIRLWYDAKTVGSAFGKAIGLPPFMFDQLDLVPTHSYFDAPLSQAQEKYPVLIFSHGYLGTVHQNTVQMEELASHGYVVFSISHTYESVVTIYPNGRVINYDEPSWKSHNNPETVEIFNKFNKQFSEETNPEKLEALIRPMLALEEKTVDLWTQDTVFALDKIEQLNEDDAANQFASHLDLERVGVFGHSMGGAAAGEACAVDTRIKAGVNLDGPQYGKVIDQPITQPFMLMSSTQMDMPSNLPNAETGKTMNDIVYDQGNNTFYRLVVQGTKHFNYCDLSMVSPVFKAVGFLGDIDGYRMEEIMNAYLLAFFDQHLKGIDSPLLAGPSTSFPKVEFQARNS
jgi:predicted dienelactone hydrolase